MKRTQTFICAALVAVTAAGLAAHPAFADGDKGKKKTVIVGTPIVTSDPPKKK